MTTRQFLLAGLVAIWVVLIALAISYCSVVDQGGQYRQLGEGLATKRSQRVVAEDYMYVADPQTKQYWPNQPKYVERITGQKVWILDDEALGKFKGYRPGPL